jgi:hypothetical protein
VKRLAARRQDPYLGARRKERRREPRRLVQDVLAPIEHDERHGIAKPGRHARKRRVGATNVDGVCEDTNGIGVATCPGELDEPDPVGELPLE